MARVTEAVGYASAVDIRTEFTRLLGDIEAEMSSVLAERDGHARPLYEMLAYHLGLDDESGPRGKRMRPLLGLLAYHSLTGDYRPALPGAAAVELGHNFSLVHDDIEDADTERRHRPTLWALWGVPLAINAGDALFALSRLALYRLLDGFSESRVLALMRVYDETCLALCEGQYLDISFERRPDVTVDAYLEMIGKKTAAIVRFAAWAGAMLGGADDEGTSHFGAFGQALGLGFQIRDDALGIWGAAEQTGKDTADDIRRRKQSLPVLLLRHAASDADRAELDRIFAEPEVPEADVDRVLALLGHYGIAAVVEARVREAHDTAVAELDALPPGADEDAVAALRALIDRMAARSA